MNRMIKLQSDRTDFKQECPSMPEILPAYLLQGLCRRLREIVFYQSH